MDRWAGWILFIWGVIAVAWLGFIVWVLITLVNWITTK